MTVGRTAPAHAVAPDRQTAVFLFGAAAAIGMVHSGFSLYWAWGGDWLLDTVGQWAVDYVASAPRKATFLLVLVAAVKAAVALAPLALFGDRRKRRQLHLLAAGACAGVLILYGAVNSAVAWLVLSGALDVGVPIDRAAMIGHGFVWDPLFLAWGLLLAAGLDASKPRKVP